MGEQLEDHYRRLAGAFHLLQPGGAPSHITPQMGNMAEQTLAVTAKTFQNEAFNALLQEVHLNVIMLNDKVVQWKAHSISWNVMVSCLTRSTRWIDVAPCRPLGAFQSFMHSWIVSAPVMCHAVKAFQENPKAVTSSVIMVTFTALSVSKCWLECFIKLMIRKVFGGCVRPPTPLPCCEVI